VKIKHTFLIISHSVLIECAMFQTKVVEKIKRHNFCSVTYFILLNHAIYEKMWENIGKPDRPQMMRMCIACWITEAADTLSEYIILNCFSTAATVVRTHHNVCSYVYCLVM